MSKTIRLKKGREKPVQQHHPWVFSGAIERLEGHPQPGELVTIADAGGRPLATAYYNPHSQISARILSWELDEAIDNTFWQARLQRAYEQRRQLALDPQTNAYRLVYGEADLLPGLIVDRYANYLVVQFLTLGVDVHRPLIVDLLRTLPLPDGSQPVGIYERSDVSVRHKEKLPPAEGVLWGDPPPQPLLIRENGFQFEVDLTQGHKTGFYLDQRDNRQRLTDPKWVDGRSVLNVFAYTGGFAVTAAAGGADHVLNIDTSIPALETAERNVLANFPERSERDEYLAGDAFEILRDFRDSGRQFDVVILDPPKFVHGQRDLQRATRGYKDINWLGLRLLRPGGILLTFSCSGLLSADLFQKILFGAAVDAGRETQILHYLHQGADHPTSLTFPESAYLKGFLCRVGS